MTAIVGYEASKYNRLPDIRSVVKTLTKSGSNALVKGALKDAIQKHNVAHRFGIVLLHAPFYTEGEGIEDPPETPINDGERLVSFGSIAVPLNIDALAPDTLTNIVPFVWSFQNGAVTPLRFAYSADPATDKLSAGDLAFLETVNAVIAKNAGAENIGVVLLAHATPGVTAVDGRVTITLPAEVGTLTPGDERYDVLWAVKGDEVVTLSAVSGGNLAGHWTCYGYNTGNCYCWRSTY